MSSDELTRRLLDEAGTTYAEQAGITLADKPMPLFELLVLCMLASKPIDATIATKAAKEIFGEKLRTPDAVLNADRKTVIDAFGRAGYARYDRARPTGSLTSPPSSATSTAVTCALSRPARTTTSTRPSSC